jgi:lipid-A-disaccharide synthase
MIANEPLRLMIVAGEASGDHHAAALVESLRRASPETNFEFSGLTGAAMRAAGVRQIVAADDLAIVGLLEVGRALPRFWRVFQKLKRHAIEEKPAAVVLVDFPEFNLPLARALKKQGVRVIYYISPQLWAWRSYRVRRVRRDVDLLLTILPFEAAWYARHDFARVEFVGHPLVGNVAASMSRAEFCRKHNLDSARPLIALLPGSRHQELARHLPPLAEAAALVQRSQPETQFVVAVAPNRAASEITSMFDGRDDLSANLHFVYGETYNALAAADAAAVASGTATLEATMTNTPMVVIYKESALNWHTLGKLINVAHFALPNLIAGERIVTELIQHEFHARARRRRTRRAARTGTQPSDAREATTNGCATRC